MNKGFQVGDFCFRLKCSEDVTPPDNFMLFAVQEDCPYEYMYETEVTDCLSEPYRTFIAERPDLKVYDNGTGEEHFIGIRGLKAFMHAMGRRQIARQKYGLPKTEF